jgi:hypothetical protein
MINCSVAAGSTSYSSIFLPSQPIAVQLLVTREDELLDRVARTDETVQLQGARSFQRRIQDNVRLDAHRTGGSLALCDPLIDQPQQILLGDDLAHRMKHSLSFSE